MSRSKQELNQESSETRVDRCTTFLTRGDTIEYCEFLFLFPEANIFSSFSSSTASSAQTVSCVPRLSAIYSVSYWNMILSEKKNNNNLPVGLNWTSMEVLFFFPFSILNIFIFSPAERSSPLGAFKDDGWNWNTAHLNIYHTADVLSYTPCRPSDRLVITDGWTFVSNDINTQSTGKTNREKSKVSTRRLFKFHWRVSRLME